MSFGAPPTPSAHYNMKMPGAAVTAALEAWAGNASTPARHSSYLQQSTAKQCQQQDKEEGTSPTPEPAYDTVCRRTLHEV